MIAAATSPGRRALVLQWRWGLVLAAARALHAEAYRDSVLSNSDLAFSEHYEQGHYISDDEVFEQERHEHGLAPAPLPDAWSAERSSEARAPAPGTAHHHTGKRPISSSSQHTGGHQHAPAAAASSVHQRAAHAHHVAHAAAAGDKASAMRPTLSEEAATSVAYLAARRTHAWSLAGSSPRLDVSEEHVPLCALALFLATALCHSSPLGSVAFYPTLLMVVGHLPVADAVPLSQVLGLLTSLLSVLAHACGGGLLLAPGAVRRKDDRKPSDDEGEEMTIDYRTCRLVLPMALLGTHVGVLLNDHLSCTALLVLLTISLAVSATEATSFAQDGAHGGSRVDRRPAPAPAEAVDGKLETAYSYKPRGELALPLLGVAVLATCRLQTFRDAVAPLLYQRGQAIHLLVVGYFAVYVWLVGSCSSSLPQVEDRRPSACVAKACVLSAWAGCLAGSTGLGSGLVLLAVFEQHLCLEFPAALVLSLIHSVFVALSVSLQYLAVKRVDIVLTLVYGAVVLAGTAAGCAVARCWRLLSVAPEFVSCSVGALFSLAALLGSAELAAMSL
eukprot:TRINITY_DN72912_c0_g1_i1.p1 TRINITY_DN72912_c0_g1~~TRINITY_DN72912_c0_g1_i1.p1  ORF type:complete len:559 (-),score=96.19 TRINITY_DN72912_c0_g1_i1:218-1894(-)